jgi:hypothetical protein
MPVIKDEDRARKARAIAFLYGQQYDEQVNRRLAQVMRRANEPLTEQLRSVGLVSHDGGVTSLLLTEAKDTMFDLRPKAAKAIADLLRSIHPHIMIETDTNGLIIHGV